MHRRAAQRLIVLLSDQRDMGPVILTVCLFLSCFGTLTEGDLTHIPRIRFSDKDAAVKRLPLPGHHAPVQILLQSQPDTVTAVGQTHLYSYNFQDPPKTPVERKVLWQGCTDCSYNITVVHKKREGNEAFVCGTNGRETLCCDLNLSERSPLCLPHEGTEKISRSIRTFVTMENEPSAFVDSPHSAHLYITYSGSQRYPGIYKFGDDKVGPSKHDKEQHYVGLMLSRRGNNDLQDKVYAFYKEKNKDKHLQSDLWLPFVTQVCMADVGGPKNNLQFKWTSQMNARLFCGNADSRQLFSELVDVATVPAERWQDTRVYALFRNEWGMSAVCVYTIQDINHVFQTSPFKDSPKDRARECVRDSTKIHPDTMRMIEETSEMGQWIQPVHKSGPLLLNHHNYTHIYADSSQPTQHDYRTVLFLSLNNGGIHKVVQGQNQTLVIAAYHPLNQSDHILSMILHPSSRKLYVNSRSELFQLNVANCAKYGDKCEDCALARDPDCSWDGTHCTPETHDTQQSFSTGDHTICPDPPKKAFRGTGTHADEYVEGIALPPQSKYFLQCPMLSHHAQYTWRHGERSIPCRSKDQECLLLINSMSHEQEGAYECVSEELGYRKVLAQYNLQLGSGAAGQLSSPLVWVCLIAALMKSLTC
ncbi:semaphorin-7A isoform X2 [Trachinotus anak]|uniref:semaphorin-7A isoform X2 n=1 Tax=Trachinotus anak TaxID=443729 RepID=UPI0039F1E14C